MHEVHCVFSLPKMHPCHSQDVEIVVQPVPRLLTTWLIGIGKLISALIKLKARPSSRRSCSLRNRQGRATQLCKCRTWQGWQQQAASQELPLHSRTAAQPHSRSCWSKHKRGESERAPCACVR